MTGPLQIMWADTGRDMVATWGDFGRGYECSEEATPCPNKIGQDPECSCNDANSANTEPNDTKYNKNFIAPRLAPICSEVVVNSLYMRGFGGGVCAPSSSNTL